MKKKIITISIMGMMMISCINVMGEETQETEIASETVESEISDDIYSFQLLLDGELYQLPMAYDEFVAKGWECLNEVEELEPNSYALLRFKKDDAEIYAYPINLGINTVLSNQCPIGELSIEDYYMEESDMVIELPKGIIFGKSSLEDVQAAYGTPSDTYEGENYTKLTYSYDYYQEVEITVDKETGVISEIDVQNFVIDESANEAAAAEISDEPTEAVKNYVVPEKLGEDLESYTVEFAGDLYQFPAPVSTFVENGWVIKPDSDQFIPGKSSGRVVLMKDNQEFTTYVTNYDANAVVPANAFVTEIEASEFGPNVSLSLPLGISMGISREELVTALGDLEYEIDSESDLFSYYTIEDPDNYRNSYTFLVKKETGVVTQIEMSHEPK